VRPIIARVAWLSVAPLIALGMSPAPARADLSARLTAALARPGLRGARVGMLVVRGDDGAVLFDRGGDQQFVPASNLKILTALAALSLLGPAHRFTTHVFADAPPDGAGAVGTLAVRGGGDPALTSEEWWRLAADLRARGLRRVRGDLVVDDGYFDAQRWNPSWDAVSARAFHAPVGALSANYGSFSVTIVPPRPPAVPAFVCLDPPVPYLQLVDRLGASGGALDVAREAAGTVDRIVVTGQPPRAGAPVTFERSVSDPLRYAAAVLRMQLAAVGIAVDGADRPGPVPAGATELLAYEGKPLAEIVRLLMKYSNNNIAETLVKDLGAERAGPPGTWPSGLAVLRTQLAALGVPVDAVQMVDGSGLSPANRVTPRALVTALRLARTSFAFGPEYVSALPLAGRDGTLEHRAHGAVDAVRAKTGLLNSAAALSGYALPRSGGELVFSILVNDYARGDAEVMAGIDALAAALVE
jgi:D-alanyl-D-alanine carboxypeptidase/D-alanyl-D-alanine-endopeptidase (penicillin-binding protein 4)